MTARFGDQPLSSPPSPVAPRENPSGCLNGYFNAYLAASTSVRVFATAS
jgi:hypothetical protein